MTEAGIKDKDKELIKKFAKEYAKMFYKILDIKEKPPESSIWAVLKKASNKSEKSNEF
jgi:hypothetical protein